VVFALAREAIFFRRAFPPGRRVNGAPCPAHDCGPEDAPFLVLETGVGAAAAARALGWLLDDHGRLERRFPGSATTGA
jgi:hypothetical protein